MFRGYGGKRLIACFFAAETEIREPAVIRIRLANNLLIERENQPGTVFVEQFKGLSVELNRQYATVYLSLKDDVKDRSLKTMEVKGGICGIDYVTLEPVEGDFRFRTDSNDEGIWMFRLPRQRSDCKLSLMTIVDGKEKDEFPLNEWIAKSGYSWLDKDLKDIYIDVDYAVGKVSIVIQGWLEGDYIDIML